MEDESIFAGVPHEGETLEEVLDSVDKELEVEKPAESQAEKEEGEPDLKQNNAWKELREERDREREERQALESRLKALESEKKESSEPSEFVTSLVGDNEDVSKKWKQERESIVEEAKQRLFQEQQEAQKKEADTKEYWNKWTQERFNEVEKEFNVNFTSDPSLKNELAKIMNDFTPTDEQGNLDYTKGMKLLTELKKVQTQKDDQKVQVKKNIADATVSKDTSTKETKDYLTRNDLRGGWRSIVHKGD